MNAWEGRTELKLYMLRDMQAYKNMIQITELKAATGSIKITIAAVEFKGHTS